MKRFIETIQNIFKIEELKNRIIFTLLMLAIYRFGTFVVIPGVDPNALSAMTPDGGPGGLEGLINLFAGGAFSRASVFALGIMPYISASIVVQLLGIAVPAFQKLQKEGESGRNKLNQYTRWLTIVITAFQAIGFIVNLKSQYGAAIVMKTGDALDTSFVLSTLLVLTAGTMFIMWIGEKITDKGLGNGISLLIAIGILARFPASLWSEFMARTGQGGGGILMFLIEIVLLFVVVGAVIALVQAVRQIPIQVARQVAAAPGQRAVAGANNQSQAAQRSYIPLKLNASGVMPIIFAQAIMFIPATVAQTFPDNDFSQYIARVFSDYTSFGYNLLLVVLIVGFTFLYTSLVVTPDRMSEDLRRSGAFIPGVKPGTPTSDYIDDVLSKITLPGAFFLALIAILPAFAGMAGVNSQFAQFYGGTSLLIMVGVVLDTLQQIESYLLMKRYDGLMKSGNIKGRVPANMPSI